jgi:iron complex transport system substrate-binding protein
MTFPAMSAPEAVMYVGAIVLTRRHGEHRGDRVDEHNVITGAVVAVGVRIHKKLGPGLLESVYEVVLARDLVRLGFRVERQKAVTFEFEGTTFEEAFRTDLIINNAVIVEVKAARTLDPVFQRQLLTYLKIMNLRLGLVMNFGMATMRAGIRRIAN